MGKEFYISYNIGKAKYTVNFHNGIKKYKDGSLFYDINIFSNKKKMKEFENELIKQGYMEK